MKDTATLALVAIYVPLVAVVGFALVRFAHGLYRIAATNKFRAREHSLWIALVLMMGADFVESLFYGVSRINDAYYLKLGNFVPAVLTMKLLIMAAAIVSVDAYCRILHGKSVWRSVLAFAFGLWAAAFTVLMAVQ